MWGKNGLGGLSFSRPDHLIEDESLNMFQRTFWLWLWTKTHLSMYVSAWLISEGSCIVAGVAYNGVDESTMQVTCKKKSNYSCHKI